MESYLHSIVEVFVALHSVVSAIITTNIYKLDFIVDHYIKLTPENRIAYNI